MAPRCHNEAAWVPGGLQGSLRLNWGQVPEVGNLALSLSSLDNPCARWGREQV